MDGSSVSGDFAEHVTGADLRLLAAVDAGLRPGDVPAAAVEAVISGETLFASPFLAFAVAVHRAVADLAAAASVPERSGSRQRVPLFDAAELRDFLSSDARR